MPVASPATPPVLSELVRVHQAFVERKQAEKRKADQLEQDRIEWILRVADQIDRRQRREADHRDWILRVAEAVDWNADPVKDLD